MTNQRYFQRVIALALPVALQMLLQSLLGMADVAMVSGLGDSAVAAVGLAAKIHFLLLVFMLGIATAGGVLIAQYAGARNESAVNATLAVALFTGIAANLPLMAGFFGAHAWVPGINPDGEIVSITAWFLVITAPVLVFTQVTVTYEAGLRSLGNVTVPLLVGGAAVLLNVFFNYVFIFGKFGLSEQGALGAAWGTLLARLIQMALMLWWVYRSRHGFALGVRDFMDALGGSQIRPFVLFSLPMVLNYGFWGLGNTIYHILMGFAGAGALATLGVMVPIESTFFASFMGLASACAVLIGHALGSGNVAEARRLQQYFFKINVVFALCCALALWLMSPLLLGLFGDLSDESIRLLRHAIAIFCVIVLLKVTNLLIIVGMLRAGGDNRYCLLVDTVVMWCVGLPIFALAVFCGAPFLVLYLLMTLEDAIKIVPFLKRARGDRWLNNLAASPSGPQPDHA